MKIMLNIKADKETKEKAQKLAGELGLPLSTIVNAYLKEFIRNRSVSFSAIPRMSKKLEKRLDRTEKDIRKGKNLSPILNTPDDIARYLSAL